MIAVRHILAQGISLEEANINTSDINAQSEKEPLRKVAGIQKFDTESDEKIRILQGSLNSINKKIDNIITAVANTGSSSLLSSLEGLEKERETLIEKIEETKKQSKTTVITETMVEIAYHYAREMFMSGDIEIQRKLMNMYLDKIVVYYNHIEFYLNALPTDILKEEIDRTLGIGEEETLVEYMVRCEPQIIEMINNKNKNGTAENGSPKNYAKNGNDDKHTFLRNRRFPKEMCQRKIVVNSPDMLNFLPRTEIKVPNPTYSVIAIGRRTLIYCSSFGNEE